VKITNIAQMVNVLQAILFTKGEQLVLTPTYFVFEMFKVHQNAALIPLDFKSPVYVLNGTSIPAVTASASRDKSGKVHITLTNADPHNELEMNIELRGFKPGNATGSVLTAKELSVHNTFDNPEAVKTATFSNFKLTKDLMTIKLPAASVIMLEL